MTKNSGNRYGFGSFELDVPGQQLWYGDEPVPLKPKVFDLLAVLVRSHGRLVTKNELMHRLWTNQVVEESNLTQSVYELRKALGEYGRHVENIPRRGYRFTAPVRELESDGPSSADIRTIAVLPFVPLTASHRDETLELGLAETLITALSRLPGLTVRPASSSRQYSNPERDSLAVGHSLRVGAVLDGTIQRAGTRLRVNLRLIRVDDGSVLWAEKFDGAFTEIFNVQDSICERVVHALEIKLPGDQPGRLAKRHTEDPEVHHLFLKCRHHWHKWTPEHWRRSIKYGKQAIERDPDHAPSYSWMAASYCALGITGTLPSSKAFGTAKELLTKALQLDESLSEAHEVSGAIALFHDWDWRYAERALSRALALNPSNAGARDLKALLNVVTGQSEDAIREVREAQAVDPLSLLISTDVGNVLYFARRFEEAKHQLRRTLDLDPWFAHAHLALGYVHLQQRRITQALKAIEAAVEYSGRERNTSPDLAYALAIAGDTATARQILDSLSTASKDTFVDPYSHALVCVGLKDMNGAFEWFERALDQRSRELIYLRANPIFDVLHTDPRFHRLTERIGI